ncbi:uncharacterized protein EAF02_007681 [Botrytis sinoallii]|uniref:uncharacterized protein n=1 Tax=Botrytis sinoallii TaxID=1463999 RepID=UPI0019003D0B|nr:uncharacterized protein EAF02_007681 [Botrytis sinoallii]KAF7880044.1 hypothetical protein EAF02_007681 [Botrytis sinoallii]
MKMTIRTTLLIISLWAIQAHGIRQLPQRTASISYNETSTSSEAATATLEANLECCYLSSFQVGQVLWYSESINITVATVSTIVYKYDDTAITSIQTIPTNFTAPSKPITRSSINGLPTTIIGTDLGGYGAETTFIHGTAFTDPYGTVYESPTPVWHGSYACPRPRDIKSSSGDEISPYPSGFFLADEDTDHGWNSPGAFSTTLPTQLRDWMVNYAASDKSDSLTNLENCKLGAGRGVPTAFVPYNEITATTTTTSIMNANYGTEIVAGSTSETAESSIPASSTISSTTSTHTTTSYFTRSITKTSTTTSTKSAILSSIQTTISAVNAAVINTITSTPVETPSSVSKASSTTSTTSLYITAGDETMVQNETMAGSATTSAISGGGLGKIVVVMDWASTSTSEGVLGAQTGTTTIPALADSTVAGVVQSSKTSEGIPGKKTDIVWLGSAILAVWLGALGL